MKIYTKKGDDGSTQIIGGTRVLKNNPRIEAYGTIDELNSYIGLIRDQAVSLKTKNILLKIQDRLFTIGALLASDPNKKQMNLPIIQEKEITLLEKEIDNMDENLAPLKAFIIPGGHTTVSFCHITRCVCRRSERLTINLSDNTLQKKIILKYLNRLSDYLFVLSRCLSKELNSSEIFWKPSR